MSDLIDRQAASYALNTIRVSKNETWYSLYQKVLDVFSNLPSAEPERNKGEWMMHSDYPDRFICSECGAQFDVWHWESEQMHFCPN